MSYSPYHVVEEMAFAEPESPLHPRAHPPSAAPPPPPTPDMPVQDSAQQQQQQQDSNNSNTRRNLYKSYQHEEPLSRAVEPPIIRHEDDNDTQSYWARAKGYWSGNVLLRPNVGLTNRYDSAVTCGQALHATVEQLRYTLIGLCATTCIVIALTWWIRFLQLQWAKLVVSVYLAFLAFLLGLSEVAILLVGIMPGRSASSSGSGSERIDEEEEPLTLRDNEEEAPLRYSQAPHRQKRLPLQDQFGFLYHPTGKFSLILFLATLCLAMGGVWEYVLGFGYLLVVIAIAILGREPEFQRLYYPPIDNDDDDQRNAARPINERSASWSYYSSLSNQSATAASLLRQAVRTQVSV